MLILWIALSLVVIFSVAIIVLLIFPFPLNIRVKLTSWISKTIYPTYTIILILFVFLLNFFFEQKKLHKKHSVYQASSINHGLTTPFDVEYFKSQRNMYIILLMISLLSITVILSKVLARLIGQHSDLQDQFALRQQAQRNSHEHEN